MKECEKQMKKKSTPAVSVNDQIVPRIVIVIIA